MKARHVFRTIIAGPSEPSREKALADVQIANAGGLTIVKAGKKQIPAPRFRLAIDQVIS